MQRDEILGMLLCLIQFLPEEKVKTVAEIMGWEIGSSDRRELSEAFSYQGRSAPRDSRKKAYQLAQAIFLPEKFAHYSDEENQQTFDAISREVEQQSLSYASDFDLLQLGSYVRGKINAFSDLDYLLVCKRDGANLVDFFSSLDDQQREECKENIEPLMTGAVDRVKIKLVLRGVKVSVLVLRAGVRDNIMSDESHSISGYTPDKSSVHELRSLRGERLTAINTGSQFTWGELDGVPVMGKIIDNIVTGRAVNGAEAQEIIDAVTTVTARKLIQTIGDPTFADFLRCLYRHNQQDYSETALRSLEESWNRARAIGTPYS